MTKQRLAYILWDLNRLAYSLVPIRFEYPLATRQITLNKARHDLFAALYKQRAIKNDPDGPWDTIAKQKAFLK